MCLLARNEGILVLLFFDCTNLQSLGSIYAGIDPESDFTGALTLTAPDPELQVLWRGLACQYRWSGRRSGTVVIMGNGFDPNLVLETSSPVTIRPLNDQMRPLAPIVAMVDPAEVAHRDATVQAGNVLFTALEPQFNPEFDPPYRRDLGNYVKVSVVQSGYSYFSSSLSGTGDADRSVHLHGAVPGDAPQRGRTGQFCDEGPERAGGGHGATGGDAQDRRAVHTGGAERGRGAIQADRRLRRALCGGVPDLLQARGAGEHLQRDDAEPRS